MLVLNENDRRKQKAINISSNPVARLEPFNVEYQVFGIT